MYKCDLRSPECAYNLHGCEACDQPEELDKIEFLKSKGWHTYYNENYWVHPKTVQDKRIQDYTNYGMSLEQAYDFEQALIK